MTGAPLRVQVVVPLAVLPSIGVVPRLVLMVRLPVPSRVRAVPVVSLGPVLTVPRPRLPYRSTCYLLLAIHEKVVRDCVWPLCRRWLTNYLIVSASLGPLKFPSVVPDPVKHRS